ncbi:hypothetical protein [Agromyces larvae]|uniref:DUF427 domain-containing protein n=1 Tax=Agromyces larvae TaxID=2929802 RepID=A0ABY4BYB2_9MICO|nr:hypothetical protein [Agromyces larvae]UOE42856.1 hypothetical protein MTO99_11725 [Agromyces larvae]
MTDYWKFDGFQHLYLEDSWVLRFAFAPGKLTIEVEFVLRESHPAFSPPLAGEQYCYRRGSIHFDAMTAFAWSGRNVVPAVDASGEMDLGSFDGFEARDDRYIITGEFGRLEIVSVPPRVDLGIDSSANSPA